MATLVSASAQAQLWNPLDTKAKPNLLVGFDTSVTMGITSDCSNCHGNWPGPPKRIEDAKVQIRNTLPMFENLFVYGGYKYEGCGSANVTYRCYPNPSDLAASYTCVDNMIASAGNCGSREWSLPGGNVTTCITGGCAGDAAIIESLLLGTKSIEGFTPPPTPVSTSTDCTTKWLSGEDRDPLPPDLSIDIAARLQAAWTAQGVDFTQLDAANVDANQIKTLFCDPLIASVQEVWNKVQQCLVNPNAFWPNVAAWLGNSSNCSPGTMAPDICNPLGDSPLACDPGQPFCTPTCVCDAGAPNCQNAIVVMDECNVQMQYRARQQVGVCESYNPNTFQAVFKAQPDNRVNPGGCRENVAMYFTDGCWGDNPQIALDAAYADLDGAYTPAVDINQRNRFVFHVSNFFGGMADAMQSMVTNGQVNVRYSATDQAQMLESFTVIVNRIFQGVYSGANMTFDRYGQRVAFHVFSVPSNTMTFASGVLGERYLNRPSRLAWHEVDPNTGVITPTPIFETDWATKAWPQIPPALTLGGLDQPRLGPGDKFRNLVDRDQSVAANSIDRTGDATVDTHPALRFGFMLGGLNTQPVIVDAPREIPSGGGAAAFAAFMNTAAVKNRPRVIYVLSNGYLHAIKGGDRRDNPPVTAGKIALSFDYTEGPDAGGEMWRYKPPYPGWLDTTRVGTDATYVWNDIVQQPILNGQIVVREMQVANANVASDYQTLLAFSQGQNGRGYAVLDVTDPMAPVVRRTWALPNASDRASQEPMLYQLPNGVAGQTKASVIITGGRNGTRTIYRYDVMGAGATSAGLPGGGTESYPTEPICLDVTGKGYITHCYVLSSIGRLVRVGITAAGGFAAISDITPTVPISPIGGLRAYYTRPVVFFGSDNAINIAFGSGDITNLVANTGAQDYFFKAKDTFFITATPPARATMANVCAPDGGGNKDGAIALAPGERVVSPPIVSKGVVAFTTFTPGGSACVAGAGKLYAFNFDRCTDAFNSATLRPVPKPLGTGIPTSPALLRPAEKVVAMTSASPVDAQVIGPAQTKGGALMPLKKLFWRQQINTR
ncbi:MAG: hypothetical protein IT384_05305 [Deltaproteobacteria bacterium]|nr:hypothetical protein [Deltaproteobacteria bacterium]